MNADCSCGISLVPRNKTVINDRYLPYISGEDEAMWWFSLGSKLCTFHIAMQGNGGKALIEDGGWVHRADLISQRNYMA